MKSEQASGDIQSRLIEIDTQIKSILPPRYQHCYSDVQPSSMGSASLNYGKDGKVDWDQIWTSFCDLAIAGGPPHRGKWLALNESFAASADHNNAGVTDELTRAIGLVTNLEVICTKPGWIGVVAESCPMAAWLTCAIIAENVAAYREKDVIYLPAAASFRVEKEIKNVVTALAKTCHYWSSHGPARQDQQAFAKLLDMVSFYPGSHPKTVADELAIQLQVKINDAVNWPTVVGSYDGWIGVACPDVETTIWLLRVLIVSGIMVRREESILYLPTGDGSKQQLYRVAHAFTEATSLRHHKK